MKPTNRNTMKTTSTKPTRRSSAAVLVAAVLTAAAHAGPKPEEPCIVTAGFMFKAEMQEAKADLNIAMAVANNTASAESRAKAKTRAGKRYDRAVIAVEKQFAARKSLCHALGEVRYNPNINPADFLTPAETAAAPNPLFPLVPGTTYNYRAETDEGVETVTVEITHRTRKILGVTCIVVHDAVHLEGSLIEDTDDWFAQDKAGNVWYFGESTAEYEDGLITSLEGAWEAGVDGARPGIIMLAKPAIGKTYRQELYFGEAEDAAEVLALGDTVTVPAGTFKNCLKTRDFSPLEPGHVEHKFYAPGIGTVLEFNTESKTRTELISVVKK